MSLVYRKERLENFVANILNLRSSDDERPIRENYTMMIIKSYMLNIPTKPAESYIMIEGIFRATQIVTTQETGNIYYEFNVNELDIMFLYALCVERLKHQDFQISLMNSRELHQYMETDLLSDFERSMLNFILSQTVQRDDYNSTKWEIVSLYHGVAPSEAVPGALIIEELGKAKGKVVEEFEALLYNQSR